MLLCYSNMYDNIYSNMYNTVTICHLKNALQKVIPQTMLEISIRDDFNKEKQNISAWGPYGPQMDKNDNMGRISMS